MYEKLTLDAAIKNHCKLNCNELELTNLSTQIALIDIRLTFLKSNQLVDSETDPRVITLLTLTANLLNAENNFKYKKLIKLNRLKRELFGLYMKFESEEYILNKHFQIEELILTQKDCIVTHYENELKKALKSANKSDVVYSLISNEMLINELEQEKLELNSELSLIII